MPDARAIIFTVGDHGGENVGVREAGSAGAGQHAVDVFAQACIVFLIRAVSDDQETEEKREALRA